MDSSNSVLNKYYVSSDQGKRGRIGFLPWSGSLQSTSGDKTANTFSFPALPRLSSNSITFWSHDYLPISQSFPMFSCCVLNKHTPILGSSLWDKQNPCHPRLVQSAVTSTQVWSVLFTSRLQPSTLWFKSPSGKKTLPEIKNFLLNFGVAWLLGIFLTSPLFYE